MVQICLRRSLKGEKFMKKRIVALFLVLVVLCTCVMLTGCEEKKEAPKPAEKSVADVIHLALKKNENLDSMSAEMKMEINMAMEGMTMSVPMTAKIKAKDLKSENMVTYVDMTMSMLGQEMTMAMYQEGQWAYMVMDDVKYKTNVKDIEDEFDYVDNARDMLKDIPKDLLKDVKPVKAEDGSQTVTVSFPGDRFTEIYGETIKDINSQTLSELGEVKISDAVVTITMADGYVTVYDFAFKMDMTVEGTSATTEAKATLTFENPGQPVTITPPEGYQNFEELDMSDSSLL